MAQPQQDNQNHSMNRWVDTDEIDLMSLASTVWRGRGWVALAAAIAVLIGGWYAFRVATPMYTSHSVVALESREEQVVDLDSVLSGGLGGNQSAVNTEVEVLRSRNLARKLVERLSLIEDPDFNGRLQPEDPWSLGAVIGKLRSLGADDKPKVQPSDQAILDATINSVLGAISISNVRQSLVFRITAVTTDPEKSALLANTLAELYILDQLEVKFDATEQATSWLTDRVAELKIELQSAEAQVKEFDANTDLISAEVLALTNRQLKDLRDRAETSRNLVKEARKYVETLTGVETASEVSELVEAAEDGFLTRLFENGATDEAVRTRFNLILQSANADLQRKTVQSQSLTTSITSLEDQISSRSEDLVVLQQLQREAEASGLIYEYFLSRLKETSVQQGIQQADSRILSAAVIPTSTTSPRKKQILVLSMMLGLFIGIGGVLLREMLQNTYRTPEELEQSTGLTVLGQIPLAPIKSRDEVLPYLSNKPNSTMAEAIRNLRTSILLSNVDAPPRVIMVTSSVPEEGKTTQSVALAENLAGMDQRVLLLEGDIRRRVFHEYFSIPWSDGFLSVMNGTKKLASIAFRPDGHNFEVLQGEKSRANAADVYASKKFRDFIGDLSKSYDFVVIDTPPILAVPDARVIAPLADAVIYVVRWDHSTRNQVSQGLRALESADQKVTGLVLGQIDPKGMKRYGYGDRYGSYNGYYEN